MSNLSSQISYLLRIVIDINKKIGGTKAYEAERKAKDKFIVLKDQISKKIYLIRNALQRKSSNTKGYSNWTQQQDDEMKQKLRDINSCLIRIKQAVQEQKSNETAKQLKMQIIEKLQQQYKSYSNIVNGGLNQGEISQRVQLKNKNYQTLTDMRANLLGDDSAQLTVYAGNTNSNKFRNNNNNNTNMSISATQIQMQKMSQWKKQQQMIDSNVDNIIQKTVSLKATVNQTGKLVAQIDSKVKQLTSNVENLTDDLTKSNKKLKGIVEKFRRPHKFCCDIILTIILIGLIVGIIKLSSSS